MTINQEIKSLERQQKLIEDKIHKLHMQRIAEDEKKAKVLLTKIKVGYKYVVKKLSKPESYHCTVLEINEVIKVDSHNVYVIVHKVNYADGDYYSVITKNSIYLYDLKNYLKNARRIKDTDTYALNSYKYIIEHPWEYEEWSKPNV